MKLNKIPIRMLLGLLLMAALATMAAQAHQAKVVTFSGGSDRLVTGNRLIEATVGQSVIGAVEPAPGERGLYLGIWQMLRRTYVVSAVGDELPPAIDRLFANYPNPFNPSTRISFSLAAEARVRIDLYDLKGRKVDTLLDAVRPAGPHGFDYAPRHLASGAYMILMRAGSYRAVQRMMLIK